MTTLMSNQVYADFAIAPALLVLSAQFFAAARLRECRQLELSLAAAVFLLIAVSTFLTPAARHLFGAERDDVATAETAARWLLVMCSWTLAAVGPPKPGDD